MPLLAILPSSQDREQSEEAENESEQDSGNASALCWSHRKAGGDEWGRGGEQAAEEDTSTTETQAGLRECLFDGRTDTRNGVKSRRGENEPEHGESVKIAQGGK